MFYVEQRNLFGHWEKSGRAFSTRGQAKGYCLMIADHLDIACRVVDTNGKIVDVIDFEAEFFMLDGDVPNIPDGQE